MSVKLQKGKDYNLVEFMLMWDKNTQYRIIYDGKKFMLTDSLLLNSNKRKNTKRYMTYLNDNLVFIVDVKDDELPEPVFIATKVKKSELKELKEFYKVDEFNSGNIEVPNKGDKFIINMRPYRGKSLSSLVKQLNKQHQTVTYDENVISYK